MAFDRIVIVGTGAWGTALANVAARAGRAVTLVARNEETAVLMRETRASVWLPDAPLDPAVRVVALVEEVEDADAVLLAVPAQSLGEVAASFEEHLVAGTPVVACAKGIEHGSRRFMTDVIAVRLPQAVPAVLSGPSFAADVAHGLPTAVTLAARSGALAADLAKALRTPTFRPYHSEDMRGAEIGGAAKNVLAIAIGIVHGLGLGASAAAALTTRGFAELARFGAAYGGRPETLTGLSGLGDLILTCSSRQSRNFSLGIAIGEGRSPEAARGAKLAEGVFTAPVLVEMAERAGVEMPISAAIDGILKGRLSLDEAVETLLARPLKAEH